MAGLADRRFSVTVSTLDLALIGCLRALAEFSEQGDIRGEDVSEKEWRAAGQKITFRFSGSLYRDLFKNEVTRLLPTNLVRFDAESEDEPYEPPASPRSTASVSTPPGPVTRTK